MIKNTVNQTDTSIDITMEVSLFRAKSDVVIKASFEPGNKAGLVEYISRISKQFAVQNTGAIVTGLISAHSLYTPLSPVIALSLCTAAEKVYAAKGLKEMSETLIAETPAFEGAISTLESGTTDQEKMAGKVFREYWDTLVAFCKKVK